MNIIADNHNITIDGYSIDILWFPCPELCCGMEHILDYVLIIHYGKPY